MSDPNGNPNEKNKQASAAALPGQSKEAYGDGYQTALLEQYKLYVEMADRVSQRRHQANTFGLAANSGLLAVSGILVARLGNSDWKAAALLALIPAAGLVLSITWFFILRSYRQLNSGKFAVVGEIENMMPIRPYAAEWVRLGEGQSPRKYWPLTHVEQIVPVIFGVLYSLAIVLAVI